MNTNDSNKKMFLKTISSPEDLKKIDISYLPDLASEIREVLIKTVSETGGHLAPNLGVIEITIALHYVYNSPIDKLIWDVGHQGYVHKLITGRLPRFHTLRQYEGISGFLKRDESEHDIFGAGHASTSISSALGLALARDINKESYNVVAIIGDGGLTGGMALEALNHAGHLGKNITIVLNDNMMSISKNLGAISQYLSKIKEGKINHKSNEEMLSYLGYTYFGPYDGHNIASLITEFQKIKRVSGPVIVHVITEKGKGYKYSELDKVKFHGIGQFNIANGEKINVNNQDIDIPSYSEIFADTLIKLAEKNPKIIAISAAMIPGTGLKRFEKIFPDRTIDVGICEQHAVTLAGGLAIGGIKPVVAIYSTFLQRAFDQIIHDICIQKLPVVFALDRAGFVGDDGPTHHGSFDLSYLSLIPNLVIMAPKDENELQHMINTAVNYDEGPIAIRYPRGKGFGISLDRDLINIPIGESEILRKGNDIAIIGIGNMVHEALKASKILINKSISSTVINARFVKPLDLNIIKEIERIGKAIVIEENSKNGGFGSIIISHLNEKGINAEIKSIGIPDEFIEHGKQKFLREKYGLSAENIIKIASNMLNL